MLFYRSSLPLSRQTLQYVTGVVGRHRKQSGSKGRALPAGMQALMTLAYLKNGETFAQLGGGFGVGTSTAWLPNGFVKPLRACSRCCRGVAFGGWRAGR
ncbi:transposase family protein [Actinomadura darangshiensis]|uniref:Transposase family protein n=1 Tax=Actinomadura darangshiensis TaxID=705336 RepID=A0A4R5B199_9ACTN|nr:transposase family protein [Actinomadura darangshiensis]